MLDRSAGTSAEETAATGTSVVGLAETGVADELTAEALCSTLFLSCFMNKEIYKINIL